MNQDNDNRFVDNNIEEQTSNQELDNFSDDSYNDVVANNKRQRHNILNNNNNNSNNSSKNYRKNSYLRNRFGNNQINQTNGENGEENDSQDQLNDDSKEKNNKSSNPLNNLNPLKKDKKDNSVDQSTQDFVKGTKKFLKIFIKLKLIILIGAIAALIVFLMVLLATIFDSDISSSEEASSAGTPVVVKENGAIVRTANQYSSVCKESSNEDFNVSYTSLTEQEFVNAVMGSGPRDGKKYDAAYNLFKQNATLVYKKGLAMGVNPELAVLRADVEGYSPASKGYTSYNNVWGFGCYNGKPLSECTKFGTFESGVEKFNNWIIKYRSKVSDDSYYTVFHDYASIGSKWNKGSAGSGGCYYKKDVIEQLEKMGEHARAEEVEKACSSGNVIPTNSIDQDAYAHYQTSIMLKDRNRIFKISGDSKKVCYKKDVTIDISGVINKRLGNIQNISFAEVLRMNQDSIENVNNQMLETINKEGPGTRDAVVAAGKFLVNALATYNYSLPYMYSGGHGSGATDANGKKIVYSNDQYYGINPYFGSMVYNGSSAGITRDNGNVYYYNGLDCSGFVGWALRNGGLNFPTLNALDYLNSGKQKEYNLTTSTVKERKAKVGDVMSKTPHHAALIVDIHYAQTDADSYMVYIEEVGDGLVVSKKDFTSDYLNKFTVINMDYHYANSKTSDFANKFKSGLIKEG